MKTNQRAWRIRKLRIWAGLVSVLLLTSAEFWMVCRCGHDCGQITAPTTNAAPALSDLVAAR